MARLLQRSMLAFPRCPAAVPAGAETDALAQSRPDSAEAEAFRERHGDRPALRAFDGDPSRLTEMDAVIAYLQSLGAQTDAARLAHEGTVP